MLNQTLILTPDQLTRMLVLTLLVFLSSLSIASTSVVQAQSQYVSAFFVLGDSSVDCGENTLLYPFLHHNLSLHPCNGTDGRGLIPHFLAEKMGLPVTPPFYGHNGSLDGLQKGLNFGSAMGTILNLRGESFQSLSQQLRQALETFQYLQLHLAPGSARSYMESSVTYLSFGKDDYIDLFLRNSSGLMSKLTGQEFARILVSQMTSAIMNLYDANARKIICMGILPLGCTPRVVWEWHNWTYSDGNERICVEEVNELVLEYNALLEEQIIKLDMELTDARIIFCDIYQGLMQIITNPGRFGFEVVKSACCGLGWNNALIGCLSMQISCRKESTHVWWDLYNPTKTVYYLLAQSAWSGQYLGGICRPTTVQELISPSISLSYQKR